MTIAPPNHVPLLFCAMINKTGSSLSAPSPQILFESWIWADASASRMSHLICHILSRNLRFAKLPVNNFIDANSKPGALTTFTL